MKYWRKHGSLDAGRRIDRTLGVIASHFASAFIKYRGNTKPSPDAFTLYPEQKPKAKASVDEQLLGFFKNLGGKIG